MGDAGKKIGVVVLVCASVAACAPPSNDSPSPSLLALTDTLSQSGGAPTVGGWGAGDLQSAYHIPAQLSSRPTSVTIGVIDLLHTPTAQSDLNAYRQYFGLRLCNGTCFMQVAQDGSLNYPPVAYDVDQLYETAIDLDMVSAACPNCNIVLVETNTLNPSDVSAAIYTAYHLGATVISMSFIIGDLGGAFQLPNVAYFTSAGDAGYSTNIGNIYQAPPWVNVVGGTVLTKAANSRGFDEATWADTGSGCTSSAKPSWQTDLLCSGRTINDIAAVASEVSIYSSSSNGWRWGNGTSVAAPLVAGIYAVAGRTGGSASPALSYAHPSWFNDITSGPANGTCGTALCNAAPGYDGPTGNGSPDAEALAGYPSITLLTANAGASLGARINIAGTNFSTVAGATTFSFGGIPATDVVCQSSSACTATAPAAANPQVTSTVDVRATVSSMTSDIVSVDQYTYEAPTCTSEYWTCNGTEAEAIFDCNTPPSGTSYQVRELQGRTFTAVSSTAFSNASSETLIVSDPTVTGTTATFDVCFAGTTVCSPSYSLTPTACVCHPLTCAQVGNCGALADGCGGTLNCGTCTGGDYCSNNNCCPPGREWNATQQECALPDSCGAPPCTCRGTTCS